MQKSVVNLYVPIIQLQKIIQNLRINLCFSCNISHTLALPLGYLEANTRYHINHEILLNRGKQ